MDDKSRLAIIETKIDRIEDDVHEIKAAVKDLTTFKLKVLGAGALGGVLFTVLLKLAPMIVR